MCLWLNFIITDDVFLYPICLAGRVCARPDQSPFVCSMSAGPGLGSLLHTTTQYNLSKRDYASAVWLKHQQRGLDGRTQTVNKAARLGQTAPMLHHWLHWVEHDQWCLHEAFNLFSSSSNLEVIVCSRCWKGACSTDIDLTLLTDFKSQSM